MIKYRITKFENKLLYQCWNYYTLTKDVNHQKLSQRLKLELFRRTDYCLVDTIQAAEHKINSACD